MLINKYKNDYKQVQGFGRDGKLKTITYYEGSYYRFPYDSGELKKNKICSLIFGLLFLALFVLAGSINADSSRTVWIVFPYLFIFLPIALFLLGVVSLFFIKDRMEKGEYEGSIIRMKNSGLAIFWVTIINIFLDVIFIIKNLKTIILGKEIFYIAILIILIITVLVFAKKYDKMFGGVYLDSNDIC